MNNRQDQAGAASSCHRMYTFSERRCTGLLSLAGMKRLPHVGIALETEVGVRTDRRRLAAKD
jgi:hypothetical protein